MIDARWLERWADWCLAEWRSRCAWRRVYDGRRVRFVMRRKAPWRITR